MPEPAPAGPLVEETALLLPPAALKTATTVAASALAVGAVAGLSYAAEAVVGAEPSVEASASASPSESASPEASASPSESASPEASASPSPSEQTLVSPTPSATASHTPSAVATSSLVRAQMSNVVVTAVDAASISASGATWTASPRVKVNLRGGGASLADVLVGMRVHLRGWDDGGLLTVEHVVVPNSPENRALQAEQAPDGAAAVRPQGPKVKAPKVKAPKAQAPKVKAPKAQAPAEDGLEDDGPAALGRGKKPAPSPSGDE